jgi:hypothetical protein
MAGKRNVDLLKVVELLHEHLTAGLCRSVFREERNRERQRKRRS